MECYLCPILGDTDVNFSGAATKEPAQILQSSVDHTYFRPNRIHNLHGLQADVQLPPV